MNQAGSDEGLDCHLIGGEWWMDLRSLIGG